MPQGLPYNGGGGGGGGGSGGPPPGLIPHFQAPPADAPHLTDKFVGHLPMPFMGDRTQAEDFLTQWELYCRANRNNSALQNQYQKTMLFLTYIQGKLVQPWVIAVARWLVQRIMEHHIQEFNPMLYGDVEDAFHRQFMDTMVKERAQAIL
jgi:hypothetical protein